MSANGGAVAALADGLSPSRLTDAGNAERFAALHGKRVRFAHGLGEWLIWDGSRWAVDTRGEVRNLAIEAARRLLRDSEKLEPPTREKVGSHALRSERRDRIMATIDLARSKAPIATVVDELDRRPDLLNVENGAIDLRHGKCLPHDAARLLTKLAPVPYDEAAGAPTWRAFLARVLPDAELRAYVQRAAGYSLTGHVSEHCLFFCYGTGANGKSTFLETLREALGEGEYAKAAAPDLLLAKRLDRHEAEIADLRGTRFVTTVEVGQGRAWDEARVKWLTGGDTLSGRFLYTNRFSFAPTHKFWIAANHKPRVAGTDLGFWRRVHLIPWTVTIPEPERDPGLRHQLRAELPGILRWAVEGAVEWHARGLRAPAAVLAATSAYRTAEDVIGTFLADCTVADGSGRVLSTALYETYRQWAERSGERVFSARGFGEALEDRSIERKRSHGQTWVHGLRLGGPADP